MAGFFVSMSKRTSYKPDLPPKRWEPLQSPGPQMRRFLEFKTEAERIKKLRETHAEFVASCHTEDPTRFRP